METTYNAIFELFAQAITNNLKFPKIRLTLNGNTVVVKLAGDKSRYTGDIMITNDAGYGDLNNRYYGRIQKSNGLLVAGRDLTPAVESLIQRFAADPIAVAKECALLTGNCIFCGKVLTDATSTAVGYGSTCAKKFSLPWSAVKQSKRTRLSANEQEVVNALIEDADPKAVVSQEERERLQEVQADIDMEVAQ